VDEAVSHHALEEDIVITIPPTDDELEAILVCYQVGNPTLPPAVSLRNRVILRLVRTIQRERAAKSDA
jgi:hypothetical protein